MTDVPALGSGLDWRPAAQAPDLLAAPVTAALCELDGVAKQTFVAPIDPSLADTTAFCERYEIGLSVSANCVVIAGRRGGDVRYAACMVLATTRADVNNVARKRLDVRKASFLATDEAVERSAMEYGGITPLGLPPDWPVLVDAAVAATPWVVVGSGVRRSKLALPGEALTLLPSAQVVDGLGRPG
ncbi:MAG: YbaK/EbsC family protein [Streptosporangiales bacterium]|nr:YbaK/EbsC family protein [Streptosporangiales bacterium]MBO0891181.1 YbaK/EbsC family protein [Acidothermales bacterium]